jgi:hypothetical protein
MITNYLSQQAYRRYFALLFFVGIAFAPGDSYSQKNTYTREQLKSIKLNQTEQEQVSKLFGGPNTIHVTPETETWTFTGENSKLTLVFLNSTKKVTEYNLFLKLASPERLIKPDEIAALKQEKMPADKLKVFYGEPTSIALNPVNETWCYESSSSKLVVTIDNESNTVESFALTFDTGKN